MPLHINLLHEEQSKIVERKRDPLKLGVLALLVIAMLFYAFYLVKASGSKKISAEKAGLDAEWAKLEPKATQAKAEEAAANAAVSASETVEKMINGRFYWGPLLSRLAVITGPEIQITNFDGAVDSENVTMKISGIGAGKEPRAVAEQFRQKLEAEFQKMHSPVTSHFEVLENTDTLLKFEGKTYATANFVIGLQMSLKPKKP